jgi:hypothetical protein
VFESEFGGDHDLAAKWFKRFAHQIFIGKWTIDLRRIEEGDTPFNRRVKKSDHLLPVTNRRVAISHPHAAESESRDFQIAVSKFTLLHFLLSLYVQILLCLAIGMLFQLIRITITLRSNL